MPNESAKDDFIKELEADGESFFGGGFWNNIIDLSLSIATVLANLAAAVLATIDANVLPRWIVATVRGDSGRSYLPSANCWNSRAF